VQIVALLKEYQETAISIRMLGKIMNAQPEGGGRRGTLRPALSGTIRFENVTFRYPGRSAPALCGIDMEIARGATIGVMGRSGSGKTTLTRLVQGLYHPDEGHIRIDGHDVRDIDLGHLRRQIGVVLQDNFLFRGTVRDNIAATRPGASLAEVVRAARMAGADEFIERLPQGYETFVDENGANLSGGQKQRIAIARALLPEPAILIFDEATSALDPESEAIVQANLADIAAGRTTIIISHRLSTIAGADTILVMDQGRLTGAGTHQELIRGNAVYRQLWQQQARLAAA
jgi:ATP-binding cassette, subfamily B, bacterial HlyB/CyaB